MKLVLTGKRMEARDTLALTFQKDSNSGFYPGDFIYLPVKLKYPDPRGNIRQLSICSSPTEKNLEVIVRLRSNSGYKKSLAEMKIGESVSVDPPLGTLHTDFSTTTLQVFIAGGVGIAPFRSRIKYLIDKGKNISIHLIYSNHLLEDISYKSDIDIWVTMYKWLKVDYIVSNDTGRIDSQKLKELVDFTSKPVFWITGSPSFVDSLEKMLFSVKIPQERIVTEKFTGY